MAAKENRPDACTASGTAKPNNNYFSTSYDLGQGSEEFCDTDGLIEYCRAQRIAYDDLLTAATLTYLSEFDADDLPDTGTLKHDLTAVTNKCIGAYNMGYEDETASAGAKLSERYPDQKPAAERYKVLKGLHPLQIALIIRELHHAKGVLWKDAGDDGNFDIGIYQTSGANEGIYDTSRDCLTRLIRSYDNAITMRGVDETEAIMRAICPRVEQNSNPDLVAVNNGVYDYGAKFLLGFDPEFVFVSKCHVDFVEGAANPVIHNDGDGTDWDVVSWMNELSDSPASGSWWERSSAPASAGTRAPGCTPRRATTARERSAP